MLFFQVLYTGDFSKEEDRHLCAAEIPSVRADVVIMVSHFLIDILFSTYCVCNVASTCTLKYFPGVDLRYSCPRRQRNPGAQIPSTGPQCFDEGWKMPHSGLCAWSCTRNSTYTWLARLSRFCRPHNFVE